MQEIWKDLPNYEGIYQVSNLGRIKSLDRYINSSLVSNQYKKGRILKQQTDKDGYKHVLLYNCDKGKLGRIHRLVCEAFNGTNPERNIVNHKNAIKDDNRPENLEWCTQKENIDHSIENSLQVFCKGEEVGSSKLTKCDVIYIREERKNNSLKELANKFDVNISCISKIVNRKSWKHI